MSDRTIDDVLREWLDPATYREELDAGGVQGAMERLAAEIFALRAERDSHAPEIDALRAAVRDATNIGVAWEMQWLAQRHAAVIARAREAAPTASPAST